jgi:DNA-binding NarL/FixJ family response regulator
MVNPPPNKPAADLFHVLVGATGRSGTTRYRRDRPQAHHLPQPAHPAGTEMAELAAEGLINRDIAAQPFLSPRTIDY